LGINRNNQNLCGELEELADKSGKTYIKPCDLMKSGDFLEMNNAKPPTPYI